MSENKEKVMKDKEVEVELNWGLEVHGVLAPVAFEHRHQAVEAIKAWKSRGWEFVSVRKIKESAE